MACGCPQHTNIKNLPAVHAHELATRNTRWRSDAPPLSARRGAARPRARRRPRPGPLRRGARAARRRAARPWWGRPGTRPPTRRGAGGRGGRVDRVEQRRGDLERNETGSTQQTLDVERAAGTGEAGRVGGGPRGAEIEQARRQAPQVRVRSRLEPRREPEHERRLLRRVHALGGRVEPDQEALEQVLLGRGRDVEACGEDGGQRGSRPRRTRSSPSHDRPRPRCRAARRPRRGARTGPRSRARRARPRSGPGSRPAGGRGAGRGPRRRRRRRPPPRGPRPVRRQTRRRRPGPALQLLEEGREDDAGDLQRVLVSAARGRAPLGREDEERIGGGEIAAHGRAVGLVPRVGEAYSAHPPRTRDPRGGPAPRQHRGAVAAAGRNPPRRGRRPARSRAPPGPRRPQDRIAGPHRVVDEQASLEPRGGDAAGRAAHLPGPETSVRIAHQASASAATGRRRGGLQEGGHAAPLQGRAVGQGDVEGPLAPGRSQLHQRAERERGQLPVLRAPLEQRQQERRHGEAVVDDDEGADRAPIELEVVRGERGPGPARSEVRRQAVQPGEDLEHVVPGVVIPVRSRHPVDELGVGEQVDGRRPERHEVRTRVLEIELMDLGDGERAGAGQRTTQQALEGEARLWAVVHDGQVRQGVRRARGASPRASGRRRIPRPGGGAEASRKGRGGFMGGSCASDSSSPRGPWHNLPRRAASCVPRTDRERPARRARCGSGPSWSIRRSSSRPWRASRTWPSGAS